MYQNCNSWVIVCGVHGTQLWCPVCHCTTVMSWISMSLNLIKDKILTDEPAWSLALLSPNPQSLHSKVSLTVWLASQDVKSNLHCFPNCQLLQCSSPLIKSGPSIKYQQFKSATFQSQLCDHVLCLVGSDVLGKEREWGCSGNEGSAAGRSPLEWGTWLLQNDPLRSLVLTLWKEIGNYFLLYWMAVIHLSNAVLYSLCNISIF
jgi:hypothetical protein